MNSLPHSLSLSSSSLLKALKVRSKSSQCLQYTCHILKFIDTDVYLAQINLVNLGTFIKCNVIILSNNIVL